MSARRTWVVQEHHRDGNLALFVFDGDSDTVLFFREHYQREPGLLRAHLDALEAGGPLPGPCPADAQARWDAVAPPSLEAGYHVVADEEESVPVEAMGPSARVELAPSGAVALARAVVSALEERPLASAYDHFNRGNANAELGRLEPAIADYDRANALEPDYEGGMAWFNRGNALARLGRDDEAAESWSRPVALGSTEWGPYAALSRLRHRQGHFEQELAACDAYLAACAAAAVSVEHPGDALALAMIARAVPLVRLGREAEALASIGAAVALDPSDVTLQQAGGTLGFTLRRWADALPHLRRSLAITRDWSICVRLGICLANLGQRDEAVALLAEAVAEAPSLGPALRGDGWRPYLDDPTLLDRVPGVPPAG